MAAANGELDEAGMSAAEILASFRDDASIIAALMNDRTDDDLDATVADVVDLSSSLTGGRRRTMRGGEIATVGAVKELINNVAGKTKAALGALDAATATLVKNVPTLVAGTATTYLVNRPTIFANTVAFVREAITSAAARSSLVTWSDYGSTITTIANEIKEGAVELGYIAKDSPYLAIMIAIALMQYRASAQGISVTDLIKQDATTVKDTVSQAFPKLVERAKSDIRGQTVAFKKAWKDTATKKTAATLREIGRRAVPPGGPGAEALSRLAKTGAPAVQSGLEGSEGAVVPGSEAARGDVAAPLFTRIPPRLPKTSGPVRRNAAAERLAAASSTEAAASGNIVGRLPGRANALGGRKHKTAKRTTKKRRVTRRKQLTFSY